MLVIVLVEVISARLAVVANVFVVVAPRESIEIAQLQDGTILRRVGGIVAGVFVGVKEIKRGFVVIIVLE